MGSVSLMGRSPFGIIPSTRDTKAPSFCLQNRKRSLLFNNGSWSWTRKSCAVVFCSTDDGHDCVNDRDDSSSGRTEVLETREDELAAARRALSEAKSRQGLIEKERDRLLEELAQSEAKKQEYVATILHDKELAFAELEATKSLFHQKLQETVEEKFSLESELVLAKQDAIELAVQVEKLAESAFEQATSHILAGAQQRISAAETSAAEISLQIEEKIRNATERSIISVVEQSKDAIEKALEVAGKAGENATKAVASFASGANEVDGIASIQSENIHLQCIVDSQQLQLLIARSEIDKLKLELEQVRAQEKASEQRAITAEKALLEFQESNREKTMQEEEEIKSLLEKIKKRCCREEEDCFQGLKG